MSSVTQQLASRAVQDSPAHTRPRTRRAAATGAAGVQATLASLRIGSRAVLAGFHTDMRPEVARRLFDLGFVPGAEVEAVRRAPLGDPVVYRVDGIEVALRASESSAVLLAA